MENKHCNNCDRTLPISEFGTYKRNSPNDREFGKVRIYHYCKECKRRLDRDRLKTDAGRIRNKKSCAKYQELRVKPLQPILLLQKYIETSAHGFFMYDSCAGCAKTYPLRSLLKKPESGYYKCCKGKAHAKPMPIKQVQCNKCGTTHNAKQDGAMCGKCNRLAKKKYRAKLDIPKNTRQRCKKYKVPYDSTVRPSLVYLRDKYTCYMCGVKCIKSKEYRIDMATIDHVIPLSKGGGHTWDNVRTACMRCNTRKGTNLIHYALEEKNKRTCG